MMQTVFQTVITLSVIGSGLAVLLLLLKPVTKKMFSARWQYYIWLVVLLALTVPVTINIPAPVFNGRSTPPPVTAQMETTHTPAQPAPAQATKMIENTPLEYRNIELAQDVSMGVFDLLALVWLFGSVVFLSCTVFSYTAFKRKIKRNSVMIEKGPEFDRCRQKLKIRRDIQLRLADGITAPLLVGILRPAVLLPKTEVTSESLTFILLHELTHYKRRDLVYKWFALLVNAVHWFNPLVYLVIKNINEDCEISCDLAVTEEMDEENKNRYMETILGLLSYAAAKKQTLTTAMCPDAKQIKRRFTMINQAKKAKKILSVISVLAAVFITAATIFTGSALADMTKDGLEYRTQNEVYFKDGVKFSVNVLGKTLPHWVNDIAGDDGNVDITINRIQIRDNKGRVRNDIILELKGTRGQAKLSSGGYGIYGTSNTILYKNIKLHEASTLGGMEFHEFDSIGYLGYRNSPVASLVSPNSGQRRRVSVYFAYDGEKEISFASVDFDIADENGNVLAASFDKYVSLEADKFEFIGDFEQAFLYEQENDGFPRFFTDFEKDYKNRKVDGISCTVSAASTDSLILKTDIALDTISSYEIYVTNDRELEILRGAGEIEKGYSPQNIILTPITKRGDRGDVLFDPPEYDYNLYSGKTYRVDIGLLDADGNIVYRQREYATIP